MEDANIRGERNEIQMKGTKFEMEKQMRARRKKGISQYPGRRSTNGDCWVHGEEETSVEARGRRNRRGRRSVFFFNYVTFIF